MDRHLSPGIRVPDSAARRNRRPQKVALEPGHSPLDWARLKSSNADLRGPIPDSDLARSGRITREELAKHNKPDDAWMVLSGRVYNVTPYVSFHPGGKAEIMRAAGKDGTRLFAEYHAWVNFEMMLDKCMVGMYVG